MERGGAQTFQRREVIGRPVAFIACEAVLRENRIPSHQSLIARGLGQDGRGGDGKTQRVAVNQRLLGKGLAMRMASTNR